MEFDSFTGYIDTWSTTRNPCACCGAKLHRKSSKATFKRSNYINFKATEMSPSISKDGKREVVCVQTSNGPISIGMRYEW